MNYEDYIHTSCYGAMGVLEEKQSQYCQTHQKDPSQLIEHPYTGIAKLEPLKYDLAGKWSRRINEEHRLIYSVNDDRVEIDILSMKYHYSKK